MTKGGSLHILIGMGCLECSICEGMSVGKMCNLHRVSLARCLGGSYVNVALLGILFLRAAIAFPASKLGAGAATGVRVPSSLE